MHPHSTAASARSTYPGSNKLLLSLEVLLLKQWRPKEALEVQAPILDEGVPEAAVLGKVVVPIKAEPIGTIEHKSLLSRTQ